jgi:transcriptional regulator with XRE-family HTH domain
MYNNKSFIGNIIRNARKKAKLSQAELSEKLGMSEKNLGNIENGRQ